MSYNHVNKKYGNQGYSHSYCKDKEHEQFLRDVQALLADKWLYAQKYIEVNNIDDVKGKAKVFAILAHVGQIRKNEPEKPKIIHPIAVATIVNQEIGFGSTSISAALLHDVVEDTEYTLDDIKAIFGDEMVQNDYSDTEWSNRNNSDTGRTFGLICFTQFHESEIICGRYGISDSDCDHV